MVQMQERKAWNQGYEQTFRNQRSQKAQSQSSLSYIHSQLANSCTVRMKVAGFHKMLVPVNQTKHHQIPDHNIHIQCHENLRSHQHINEVTEINILSLLPSNVTYPVCRNQTCLPVTNNVIWMQCCSKISISPFLWNPFKFEEQLTVC